MDGTEMYAAVLDALTEHARQQAEADEKKPSGLLPITPFTARNCDGDLVKAVGIIARQADGDIEFVVLKQIEGGEIYPATESSLFKNEEEQ